MTSTASQVTTPNWSDQNTSTNKSEESDQNQKHDTSANNQFESPLRLQSRSPLTPSPYSQSSKVTSPRTRDFSDAESISSSVRGGRVVKRRPSRRRSKAKSPASNMASNKAEERNN